MDTSIDSTILIIIVKISLHSMVHDKMSEQDILVQIMFWHIRWAHGV